LSSALKQNYSDEKVNELLRPIEELEKNEAFWNHSLNGLAIFRSSDLIEVIGLLETVKESVTIARNFHTIPLQKYLQSIDRYQILSINLQDFRLYEGNRHSIVELEIVPSIPKTLIEALGKETTEKHITVASYGGVGIQSNSIRHSQSEKNDEIEKDAERFFRIISNAIEEHYSKPSGLPLILATLPEHQNIFHKVSKNPLLVSKSIGLDTKSLTNDKLIKLAWEIMEQNYLLKLKKLSEHFIETKVYNNGSDSVKEVAKAAVIGRIETLMIEDDRIISGKVNKKTGIIENGELQNPEPDNLLDNLGELVIEKGGNVIIMSREIIPSKTGLAAIFRY
jgi:hypothetical protein